MTIIFPLDFLVKIQVWVEKMAFIQEALENWDKNQIRLMVKISYTTVNQQSSGF
jgi:hypothetical protein